ncbi:hypothetical protein Tsubulata_006118 [Turnera subulata]|uniref:Uncharacterized protein n=1 Tax=Turnera subulata TaxID=218843 RepID=A0A9Q0FZ49_9ROSI|nr:hypothetical protein Tsubulata_006118 [Turnera subulata]
MANAFGFCKYLVLLFIFLISTSHLSLSSQEKEDIHDLLPKYGLPRGLIPDSVESYAVESSKFLYITLSSPCAVMIGGQHRLQYGRKIRGMFGGKGALHFVSGIEVRGNRGWRGVTKIVRRSNGFIEFDLDWSGFYYESFDAEDFDDVPVCSNEIVNVMLKSVV